MIDPLYTDQTFTALEEHLMQTNAVLTDALTLLNRTIDDYFNAPNEERKQKIKALQKVQSEVFKMTKS